MDLKAIKDRRAAISPGTWSAFDYEEEEDSGLPPDEKLGAWWIEGPQFIGYDVFSLFTKQDAVFIVNTPDDIDTLVKRVDGDAIIIEFMGEQFDLIRAVVPDDLSAGTELGRWAAEHIKELETIRTAALEAFRALGQDNTYAPGPNAAWKVLGEALGMVSSTDLQSRTFVCVYCEQNRCICKTR